MDFADFTDSQGLNPTQGGGGGGGFSLSGGLGGSLGAVGLGLGIFGTLSGMQAASQQSQLSIAQVGHEEQIEQLKQQQMHLQSQRQSVQNLRDVQQAQAMGKAAAANAGALFGSGLAGGQSQEAAKGGWNAENLSQNLQIGDQIFSQDYSIDALKIQQAQAASRQATSQGETAIGGDILSTGLKILGV
jgi:hypothetical protein